MAKISPEPVYLKPHLQKILEQRIAAAQKILRSCTLLNAASTGRWGDYGNTTENLIYGVQPNR